MISRKAKQALKSFKKKHEKSRKKNDEEIFPLLKNVSKQYQDTLATMKELDKLLQKNRAQSPVAKKILHDDPIANEAAAISWYSSNSSSDVE